MEKETPLVSIIIPVYNGEKYLDECIQSAINQTYKNIEVIIVNDGSTDGSLAVINRYAGTDERVKCVNKTNEGLVKARKTGVSLTTGKYVQHLDSDDILCADAIEILLNKAEQTGADVVSFPFILRDGEENKLAEFFDPEEAPGVEYIRRYLNFQGYWTVWSKFHLRSLYSNPIEEIDISFGEDLVLTTQLLYYSKKVVSVDRPLLYYRVLPNSMSNSMSERNYEDLNAYLQWTFHFIEKIGLKEEFKQDLAYFHLKGIFLKRRWGKVGDVYRDLKYVVEYLRLFPELRNSLPRREQKIVALYELCGCLGYLKIWYYKRKGKF